MSSLPRMPRALAVILAAGVLTMGVGGAAVAAAPMPEPPAAAAADSGDREGPHFYSALAVDVSEAIDGDVYATGQTVTISGDISGDVIAAAQTINITGTVDGDVRLAAQDVSITGGVSRSGTVFASTFTVGKTGSFGDDVVAAAARVNIAGEVGRNVVLSADRLVIDGSVRGDVTYMSGNEARIADDAVGGAIERIEPPKTPRVEVSPWALFIGWFLGVFYALVALSLIALFAGLLFPRWLHRVTDQLVPSPWRALLVGFVASFAVPIALVFLGVTIIGAPLALLVALVWTVMVLAAFIFSAYYIGRLVFRDRQHPVVLSLVGGVILIVALQVPWLHIVVGLAAVFFGLGAQLLEVHRQRPWHRMPATTVASQPAATEAPVREPTPHIPPAPEQ